MQLEAHGFRKKHRQALLAILSSVLDLSSFQVDVKKVAKEDWEILQTL